jgi:hypothetical protein
MSSVREIACAIRTRIESIREWMDQEAPYVASDQRHMDEHTPERAYWHYGYQAALSDVLALMERGARRAHDRRRRDNSM